MARRKDGAMASVLMPAARTAMASASWRRSRSIAPCWGGAVNTNHCPMDEAHVVGRVENLQEIAR
eukprot:scaffold103887_cov33-Phaeocystis_antarctica.AAC.1